MRTKDKILSSDVEKHLQSEGVEHAKLEVLIDIRDQLERLNNSLDSVLLDSGGRKRLQVWSQPDTST